MGYSIVKVDELEGSGPGGAVRFVRRELGVEAFGINWFELPPNAEGHEHDESESGQEEVNVIVRGSGTYRIDGEEIPVAGGPLPPLRRGHDAHAGRRSGGPDDDRGRRTPRQLRAAGAVLTRTTA